MNLIIDLHSKGFFIAITACLSLFLLVKWPDAGEYLSKIYSFAGLTQSKHTLSRIFFIFIFTAWLVFMEISR